MQLWEKMRRDIGREGFFIMAVAPGPDSHGFAYTIGLSESMGHPELLVFSLPPQVAFVVLHDFVKKLKEGARFTDGQVIDDIFTVPVPVAARAISHEKAAEYTVQLFNMYAANPVPPSVLQMVLPDTRGRFPWHSDFDQSLETMQPALWTTLH